MPWDYYDRPFFPPSRPLDVEGGIRSQSKKGAFGQKWWARRWIATLESFQIGSRLQRGRSYARRGQVISINIGAGHISARVQGSSPTPYNVTIRVKPLSRPAWKKVADVVSSQALFASKLLGGEMPNEMEDAFRAARVSLFPERYADLNTDCDCPDWSNPCKHIAAVYYLLGEEFDRDPFLIFKMRGIDRDEFLAMLGETVPREEAVPALPPEPLPDDPERFWKSGTIPADLAGEADLTADRASLPRRLGKFPFWRGSEDLFAFLDDVYRAPAFSTGETSSPKSRR
jgi:uncharacterized Zn finger protein